MAWVARAADPDLSLSETAEPTTSATEEASTSYDDSDLIFEVPEWIRKRNAVFAEEIRGKLILAPLTKVRIRIVSTQLSIFEYLECLTYAPQ